MNTARRPSCQTLRVLGAIIVFLSVIGPARAGNISPPATPAPPPWQQEIDAARLLEGSLTLDPPKDAAETEARRRRLRDLYRQLAGKYPEQAAVQKAAGDYYGRDGQPAVALNLWEKAGRLDPHDADTAERLGGAYLNLGRARDAYGQFQRAAEDEPQVPAHQSDLANVLYVFRQELVSPPLPGLPDEQAALAQALVHFRRAAELDPTSLRLAQAYAETFYVFAKPDWAQALAAWEAVRTLSGEKSDFPNSHLARISLRLGQPDAAAGYLELIRDPAFNALKAKLLKQVEQQRAASAHR